MSSADNPRVGAVEPSDLENKAMGRFVRILCDARLAALALTAVLAAVGQAGLVPFIILFALPFSWFPVRYWDQRGAQILTSRILLFCDVAMTLTVTFVLRATTDQFFVHSVYLVVSLILWGLALDMRVLLVAVGVVFGLLAVWVWLLNDDRTAEFLLLAAACAASGWVGRRIRRTVEWEAARGLEAMNQRAEQVVAQERMLLGREMHDSLAKTVHGVSLLAQSLAITLEREGSAHSEQAELIHDACTEALADARDILSGIRVLAHDSLAVGVRLEVDRFRVRSELEVQLELSEDPNVTVDAESSWAVVRILGELLSNVQSHARATAVSVTLRVSAEGLRLVVADDGKGMAMSGGSIDTSALALGGHYGLIGVQERAEAIAGSVRVHSSRSRPSGTTIDVRLPTAADDTWRAEIKAAKGPRREE